MGKKSKLFNSLFLKLSEVLLPKLKLHFFKSLKGLKSLKKSRLHFFVRNFMQQRAGFLQFFKIKKRKVLNFQKFNFIKIFKKQFKFLTNLNQLILQKQFVSFIICLKNFEQKTYEHVLLNTIERFIGKFLINRKKMLKYFMPHCYSLFFFNLK